jgi:MoxR-like ATPase
MPSEITGGTIFDKESQDFIVRQGPIFTQLVVADEINRATPRTQSALLEAMSESSVSIDGKRHALDAAFTVIATQNPAL